MIRQFSIELDDVTVAFAREGEVVRVLQHIDLEIQRGEKVAVVGANGSGKSTLLRVIAGLSEVSRGKVKRSDSSLVPMVFQNPDAQIVGETVEEDICFGLENIAVPRERMRDRVRRALSAVGLEGFEERQIERLSGGQKQLVCIAAAIALDSPVIVLDEPTAMLDPVSKADVLRILEQLHQEGKTVIWATQAMDEAGYADRVVAVASGSIAFAGTPAEFFYGARESGGGRASQEAGEGGAASVHAASSGVAGGRETALAASSGMAGGRESAPAASSDVAGGSQSPGPPPCERLGFQPPYTVQVVHELHRRGLLRDCMPVRADECMEAVMRLCR